MCYCLRDPELRRELVENVISRLAAWTGRSAEGLDAYHRVFFIFLSMQRLLIDLRALPGAKVVEKYVHEKFTASF